MILPIKYQAQVLQMLHDGHGHKGMERTIVWCRECFYWNMMYKDVAECIKNVHGVKQTKVIMNIQKQNQVPFLPTDH